MEFMEAIGKMDVYAKSHTRLIGLLFAAILILISIRYGYLVWTTDDYTGETVMYNFAYADAIFNGIAPYTPDMGLRWEYPPFAYILMLIPRFFTSDVYVYEVLYVAEVAVFLLIGLWLILKFAKHYDKNPLPVLIAYAVSVYMLDYFIYDRFDVIVAVILMGACYCYIKDQHLAAIFLVVFGMFAKLYPAIILPLMIVPFLAQRKYVGAVKYLLTAILMSVLFILPFAIMSPDNVWNFLTYHSSRGLQIESVAASFILFFELFGLTSCVTDHSYGSYNITGGISDPVSEVMMLLMIIALLAVYVGFFFHCRANEDGKGSDTGMLMAVFLAIMAFILFNKVFSAQYVVWVMIAFFPLVLAYDDKVNITSSVACILLMLLTMWMVATYDSLLNHEAYGVCVLLLRNLLFIAMFVYGVYKSEYVGDTRKFIHSSSKPKAEKGTE